MVNISNFWGMGSSMNATVLNSGDISIPDGQYVFTNSSYLDFYAYAFDLETQDLSNTGEILLKYDAYNDTYESTPFIVMCESAYYGIFYLLMQHN